MRRLEVVSTDLRTAAAGRQMHLRPQIVTDLTRRADLWSDESIHYDTARTFKSKNDGTTTFIKIRILPFQNFRFSNFGVDTSESYAAGRRQRARARPQPY